MAESSSAALAVASIPSSAEISRAEKLVRERFLHDGEDAAVALAAGSPRRLALDAALAELQADPKAKNPSTAWRREFSLLLGLERVLSEDEPKLADGTVLSAHQVDALSGTLAALLAAAQVAASNGNGRAAASASPELLASAEIFGPEDIPTRRATPPARDRRGTRRRRRRRRGRGRRRRRGRGRRRRGRRPRPRPARGARRGRRRRRRSTTTIWRRRRRGRATRPRRSPRPRPRRSRATGPTRTTTRSRSPTSPRTPTPPSASGSSTRPAPARRSLRSASSRPRRPAAC